MKKGHHSLVGLYIQLKEVSQMSVVMCRMECKVDGNGLSHYIIYDEQGEMPF
jgi:modified peptide precursor CbpA